MKQLILSLLFALSFTLCNAQNKVDTSLYRECVVSKIEHSMVGGGKCWRVTLMSNNERVYEYRRRKDYQEGECILMGKDIFEELKQAMASNLKNKK